jgi:transposase
MEIISGVERRRRRWRPEDKLRILAEIEGGASLTEVARRHDVSRGLIWQWRDAQRRGRLVEETPSFVPVRVMAAPSSPEPECLAGLAPSSPPGAGAVPDERIEIVLPDGTAVRVSEAVGLPALRRVLAALRG